MLVESLLVFFLSFLNVMSASVSAVSFLVYLDPGILCLQYPFLGLIV